MWTGGDYGHVAICLGEGDLKAFKTIDQNWKSQTLTEEWHNYTYLGPLVFLRTKNQENIVEASVQTVTLPASVQSWRVYPLDKTAVVGNECGKLLPAKKGGLTYDILRWTQKNVAVISTRDFGEVQIYVGADTEAVIK